MNVLETAKQAEGYIPDRRRYYHQHPELSGQEKNTSEQLVRDLEALGITEIHHMKNCYGLTAVIRGSKPGKLLGIRSDMDALPIREETGLPFASQNEGVMHACGHDSHMAILLGAAKILQAHRDELCGGVKLIFQPSEENASGAKWMAAEHAADDVDALLGAHVWGTLDAPLIDVSAGNRMAGADLFSIDVNGRSSHGGEPHLGMDAISIGCAIVNNLQQCVSRMNDPLHPEVLTIGEFAGGPQFNVISDHVWMQGTTRYFTRTPQIEGQMRRIIEQTEASFGADATLNYEYKSPAVVNSDSLMNRVAHDTVVKLFGNEALGNLPPMMGGEDFAQLVPAGTPTFFAFIGSRNAEKGITHTNHQAQYTVDEDILVRGAAFEAQFALDYLANA